MKRLTVRLSIVGAVLALGGAAIAHSVLSRGKVAAPDGDSGPTSVAIAAQAKPPAPIPAEDRATPASSDSLQPPPTSAFSHSKSLRTVSHQNTADPADGRLADDSAASVPTADPIPTLGANGPPRSAYSEYSPASGSNLRAEENDNGNDNSLADADRGSNAVASDGSTPADPPAYTTGFAVPATPEYGSDPDTSGTGTSAASSAWEPPASNSTIPTPPPDSSIPRGNRVEPAASDGGAVPGPLPTSEPPSDAVKGHAPPPAVLSDAGAFGAASPGRVEGTPRGGITAGTPTSGATLSPGPEMTNTSSPALSVAAAGLAAGAAIAGASELTRDASSGAASSTGGTLGSGTTAAGGQGTYPSTVDASGHQLSSPEISPKSSGPSPASPVSAAVAGTPELSSNVPGDRALEGQQSPAIVIEKTAPDEVQVDRPATFQIRVRNVGTATAHNVVVLDPVPRGTEFVSAVPECARTTEGLLIWNFQALKTNEEVILSINLLPKVAGEIGSVAQATFQTQASVRTLCTKPQLTLELSVPEQVLIGTAAALEIVVTNIGSGAATNVVMEEDVPEGFTHAAGRQLEHEIGTLRPGESRRLTLAMDATTPGLYDNRLVVRGDGDLFEEDLRKIEVATPKLELSMQGPALRYLDRQATYVVRLANSGTAPARNVELVTYLPKGMKYVTSDNHGQYDSKTHAVYWSLEELPAEKQGDVHLTVLPIEPGNHKLKTDGHAELGLQHSCEHEVVVEGLAELSFSVTDAADPIEMGSDTTYEIQVHNRGSKADSDIRIVAELPPGMTPTTGDGPVQAAVQGQQVVFSPLARLAPNEEAVYKIHAVGEAVGDHVIRVQLRSAELRVPVTKEEITRVYADR